MYRESLTGDVHNSRVNPSLYNPCLGRSGVISQPVTLERDAMVVCRDGRCAPR
jgi:hypothetical protein